MISVSRRDAAVLIDDDLLPLWAEVEKHVQVPLVVVHRLGGPEAAASSYEAGRLAWHELLASTAPMADWPDHPIDENAPVSICYTSGTTGHPKGCMHTHRSVMYNTVAGTQWIGTPMDGVSLAVLPLFHVPGMQNGMNGTLFVGATVVLLPRWDRDAAAQLIQRYKVTGTQMIVTMVVDLLSNPRLGEYDLSSIARLSGGGAAMPEAIATKLKEVCNLDYLEGYAVQ